MRTGLLLGILGLGALATGQRPLFSLDGNDNLHLGTVVANAGDVDGDGFDDIIAGAPRAGTSGNVTGAAYVWSGRDGTILHTFLGVANGDDFGVSVDGAGDFDGDGHADLIVGSPGNGGGSATVFSGRDGSVLCRMNIESGAFGTAVAGAGDVNGDGFDDVIVGAPNESGNGANSGSARVYAGNRGPVLLTIFGNGGGFGSIVDGVGDVDGDGFDDVAIGAPQWNNSGQVRVVSGRTGATLHTLLGRSPADEFGAAVAGVGDLDGDGFADIGVGSPGEDLGDEGLRFGAARVFSGQTGAVLHTWRGLDAADRFGTAIAAARDVNGDGVLDVIVGVPNDDDGGADAGTANVYSGDDGRLLLILPSTSFEIFGTAVAALDDVNGDGRADLVVGAPGKANLIAAGQVTLFAGAEGRTVRSFAGAVPNDRRGASLSSGDVNGDGVPDQIVGTPGDDTAGLDAGAAHVYSGTDGSILHTFLGSSAGDALGTAVAWAGDVNRDGFGDVLVGAPSTDIGTEVDVGTARLYSGRDGAVLQAWNGIRRFDSFGQNVAAAGDVDGDGILDVLIGSLSWYVRVWSGSNGSMILSINPNIIGFGTAIAGVGDTNGDGHGDLLIGSPNNRQVQLRSGRDGSLLFSYSANVTPGSLCAAGDVDHDGYADFAILDTSIREYSGRNGTRRRSIPLSGTGLAIASGTDVDGDGEPDYLVGTKIAAYGAVRLISGASLEALCELHSIDKSDGFGTTVAFAGDVDADGRPEVLAGAPTADGARGEARLLSCATPFAGTFTTFGAGCRTGAGTLPRLGHRGRPAIGGAFDVTLRSAPASAAASLHVDVARQDLDLGLIGFPDCRAFALPFFAFNTGTDAIGAARLTLRPPDDPTLVGGTLHAQWFALDLAAASVVVSNGGSMTFGVR